MKNILVVDDMSSWRDFNINAVYEILGKNVNIEEASSADEAYTKIIENNSKPYDIVITDLQMENSYEPKYAGEWLVEQIRSLPKYYRTKIIMISGAYNARKIAENLNIDCIPKSTAVKFISAYKELLED